MLAEVPDFSVESVFLRIFRQMKKIIEKIKEVTQMNIFETVKAAVTLRQQAVNLIAMLKRQGDCLLISAGRCSNDGHNMHK